MSEPERLELIVPPAELYTIIGMINFSWAMLDAVTSAAYIAALDGDAVEIGLTLGRMETRPKLLRLRKIYQHRKDTKKAELLNDAADQVEEMRGMRNALTHGFYLGRSRQMEFIWAILPDFQVASDFSGTDMFVATMEEMTEHQNRVLALQGRLLGAFDQNKLRRLFALPNRVR